MEKAMALQLYKQATGYEAQTVTPLTAAGSARHYSRINGAAGSLIFTEGSDHLENEAFIYLTRHFTSLGLSVPQVVAVANDVSCYLQTDLGDCSLYNLIEKKDPQLDEMLDRSMRMLADFHRRAASGLDFSRCFPVAAMDKRAVMWDLNYFKYCFLKAWIEDFSEPLLEDDFERLADMLTEDLKESGCFILRDFQSRNVMIDNGRSYAIDYQGGRKGMPQYDVASFLWQSRAGFSDEQRQRLMRVYADAAGTEYESFATSMPLFVLFRTLQTLGAYGFRGCYQQKQKFVSAIPAAIANLRNLLPSIPDELKYLRILLVRLCEISAFIPHQKARGLTVRVSSFSYRKGVPRDPSGNGGGFVFDCRAIHNPGRYDEYKPLTGRDGPVIDFLEDNGEVFSFLDNVYALVDSSVKRYLSRGFDSLQVDFGCTGGRHRSVYCAEALAKHLAERGDVNVELHHREHGITLNIPAR